MLRKTIQIVEEFGMATPDFSEWAQNVSKFEEEEESLLAGKAAIRAEEILSDHQGNIQKAIGFCYNFAQKGRDLDEPKMAELGDAMVTYLKTKASEPL
jgi:hypothetical protein